MRRNLYPWFVGFAIWMAALIALLVWRMPEVAAWSWYVRSGKPAMTAAKVSLARQLRWFDDYYAVANLSENAYAIGEPLYGQCNFSYLIVGSARALLFDTGPGVRDIRPIVHALTAVPIEVLPSHLHFDHVGNLDKFEDVLMPDLPRLRRQLHGGRLSLGFYQFLGFVEGFKRPSFPVTRWVAPGSEIDLGDRQLTLLSVPGHTPDSVVLLDHGANRLFAGDFIYPSEIYAFLPGANLSDYVVSAQRVLALLNDHSMIYGGHGCDSLPTVEVPVLRRSDVAALEEALLRADTRRWEGGKGWYPREISVNERMKLLAKYPWMRP
jgi:glyoxylase-like metal-dependent hydrolase (beta-lactamase superfamily II)